MNKQLLIGIVVATAVATAISFGTTRWCCNRQAPAGIPDATSLRHTLRLSEMQATEIEKLDKSYRNQLAKYCVAHCAARADLATELCRPIPDSKQAAACCQRMCTVQTDSERFTLEHILQVRALLTPAQQKQYATLIQQQLTGSCTMQAQ